ncbi:MAG: class I SAM-dependent methyltransferase [Pirellulales bacterium]|nr:class I SAM-dependent methyltransferase [Pirellulales bacterium]
MENVEDYYDTQYNIQVESREQDDLYKMIDGKAVYRVDHQMDTLLKKMGLPKDSRVLDYGCGKSATLRRLASARPDLDLHVFDVSDAYVDFWKEFLPEGNWATHSPDPAWRGSFDVVTSFFALEHATRPCEMVGAIHGLLRPSGLAYCLVPNVYRNPADFVVIDHVNHFSEVSLRCLFESAGFEIIDLDPNAHDAALVVIACKTRSVAEPPPAKQVASLREQVDGLCKYWNEITDRVRRFESDHNEVARAAVYGAGFYGLFIVTCLRDPSRIECFVDQNAFYQGSRRYGKPIIAPAELAPDIELLYVGLNPAIAQQAMADTFGTDRHTYFYL